MRTGRLLPLLASIAGLVGCDGPGVDAPEPNSSAPPSPSALDPQLVVHPPEIALPRVVAPTARTLTLANTGLGPLRIDAVVLAQPTEGIAIEWSGPSRLEPGQMARVEVELQPLPAPVETQLLIRSTDPSRGTLAVPVRLGPAAPPPPCVLDAVPAAYGFGTVPKGRSARWTLPITNDGSVACALPKIRIRPEGGSENGSHDFALSDEAGTAGWLAPSAQSAIAVELSPKSVGLRRAVLELGPPEAPKRVQLSGFGTDTELVVVPHAIEFGTVNADCRPRHQRIRISNPGAAPLTVETIALGNVHRGFRLAERPSLPLTLTAGHSVDLAVAFVGDLISGYADTLTLEVSGPDGPEHYRVPVRGARDHRRRQVDRFRMKDQPKVDVLFVVDASTSMRDEQAALGANFQAFIQFAEAQGLDYQIGVTTTDEGRDGGRLVSAQPGTTHGATADGPEAFRIVSPTSEPSPDTVFAANVSLALSGDEGSRESGLLAAVRALSSANQLGRNAGFLRPDAILSVIVVSDEPDQSPGPVDGYVDALMAVKGFGYTYQFSASAIAAPFPPGRCSGYGGVATSGGRYLRLAERTGGVFQSICSADWFRAQDLSTQAFGFKYRIHLSRQPVTDSIELFVNGAAVPKQSPGGTVNWTYDHRTNSVSFVPYSIPEPGASIRVEYRIGCP